MLPAVTTPPTVYRQHKCARRHRTFQTFAKCVWPRAAWIAGTGPFAVVAYCRHITVTLHPDAETAQAALAVIDGGGCGGRCSRHHRLVRLEPPT